MKKQTNKKQSKASVPSSWSALSRKVDVAFRITAVTSSRLRLFSSWRTERLYALYLDLLIPRCILEALNRSTNWCALTSCEFPILSLPSSMNPDRQRWLPCKKLLAKNSTTGKRVTGGISKNMKDEHVSLKVKVLLVNVLISLLHGNVSLVVVVL